MILSVKIYKKKDNMNIMEDTMDKINNTSLIMTHLLIHTAKITKVKVKEEKNKKKRNKNQNKKTLKEKGE